jgi:hypothetical protein
MLLIEIVMKFICNKDIEVLFHIFLIEEKIINMKNELKSFAELFKKNIKINMEYEKA